MVSWFFWSSVVDDCTMVAAILIAITRNRYKEQKAIRSTP